MNKLKKLLVSLSVFVFGFVRKVFANVEMPLYLPKPQPAYGSKRSPSILEEVQEIGIKCLPIIPIILFFIGFIVILRSKKISEKTKKIIKEYTLVGIVILVTVLVILFY